jgi:hypothetical protein
MPFKRWTTSDFRNSGFRDDYRQSLASGNKLRLTARTMAGAGVVAIRARS